MEYNTICLQVIECCKEVGGFILNEAVRLKSSDIETKSENNFVTWVDKESERRLVESLARIIPGCGFIAEEKTTADLMNEFTWVIDPLDGTTNFIHGIPIFCISIGLLHQDELVMGVIYELNSKEMFHAWKGGEAWLNARPIHVSKTMEVKDALLATGFPYYDYKWLDEYLELFKYFMKSSRGVRRLGSAAADLAWVACGRFDGFYEYGLSPWDVAAGACILKEAGGMVGDFSGGNDFLFGKEIIAANPGIFISLLSTIREYFLL
jgi:myo-inositol-1(or 4)-monophosphatase